MKICTVNPQNDIRKTDLCKSLTHLYLHGVIDNTESISEIYNQLIDRYQDEDYLILCHDDVTLKSDPRPIIEMYLKTNDMLGVAGATNCHVTEPCLWHIMGGEGNLRGNVEHGTVDNHISTFFGPTPAQVINLDGVFVVLSKKLMQSGLRYDEDIPSKFHFYDIDFSLRAWREGFKPLAINIPLIHASGGLKSLDDEEFLKGQTYFKNKHG